MKTLTKLTDMKPNEIFEIFEIADEITAGKYSGFLKGKARFCFFRLPVSGRV